MSANYYYFAQALVKFKIAKWGSRVSKNQKTRISSIVVTKHVDEDPTTYRLFQMLYLRLRSKNIVFDPLGEFHDDHNNDEAEG